jgi:hypothetical protein
MSHPPRFRQRAIWGFLCRATTACAILLLAAPAAAENKRTAWFNKLFHEVRKAQDSNTYFEYLQKNPVSRETIEKAIAEELEAIKKGSRYKRVPAFKSFMLYHSAAKGGYQTGALRFYDRVNISDREIDRGKFDPQRVAGRLVGAVETYLHRVLAPILAQVETELHRDLLKKNLVFLGRDFTPAYLWARARGRIPKSQLFLINASRDIKDAIVVNGQRAKGRTMLGQLGFDTAAAIQGTAFLDSSMSGKIPAALLRALVDKLKPEDIYKVLTRAEVRYIHTQPAGKPTLAQVAKARASGSKGSEKLSQSAAKAVLNQSKNAFNRVFDIPTFDFTLPPDPDGLEGKAGIAKYEKRRKHKLFEWLPKMLTTARAFASDGKGLKYSVPSKPEERVKSLLGLYADLELIETQRTHNYKVPKHKPRPKAKPITVAPEVKPEAPVIGRVSVAKHSAAKKDRSSHKAKLPALKQVTGSKPQSRFKAIDKAVKGSGVQGLYGWLQQPSYKVQSRLSQMKVVNTGDKKVPYYLEVDGQRIFDMTKVIGHGRTVTVFLTTNNTVLKVPNGVVYPEELRDQTVTRKLLLSAWAGPKVAAAGLDIAKNLQWDKDGLWVEQEYIDGKPLSKYVRPGPPLTLKLPGDVKATVEGMWKKAAKLTKSDHIYLDFKAPNMVLTKDRRVVHVDYVPLTKRRYYRYFRSKGKALPPKEFFRRFTKLAHVPKGARPARH